MGGRSLIVCAAALAACASACSDDNESIGPVASPQDQDASVDHLDRDAADDGPTNPRVIELRLVFVHGVVHEDASRLKADTQLADLETAVLDGINARMSDFERLQPGRTLKV